MNPAGDECAALFLWTPPTVQELTQSAWGMRAVQLASVRGYVQSVAARRMDGTVSFLGELKPAIRTLCTSLRILRTLHDCTAVPAAPPASAGFAASGR